jgi:hypothetical protein
MMPVAMPEYCCVEGLINQRKGEPFDIKFMRDRQAALDYAFNAIPTVTRLGKELTTAYFGRSPHHIYSAEGRLLRP